MNQVCKLGFWSGMIAFTATVGYCVIQIMQVKDLIGFPADEIAIYSISLCIAIPFLLEMLSLHYSVTARHRIWTHAALLFATLYCFFVVTNYVVQLATVIPAKLDDEYESVRILDQTPHSLFWDFDALGYIFMGFSMLMASFALESNGFQRWVKISLLANALVTPVISYVYFFPVYSEQLLKLGYIWGLTAPLAMLMVALYFRVQSRIKLIS